MLCYTDGMNTQEGRPRPYIGVSGVVKQEHVEPSGLVWHEWQHQFLQAHAEKVGLYDTGRMLALGVKATHKTQFDDIENKYGKDWYPVGEKQFEDAVNPKLLNKDTFVVAQTYLDVAYVDDADYRKQFTRQIAHRGRNFLHAIQFDMLPWHRNDEIFDYLEKLKASHDLKVLLQVHGEAMNELGPQGVVQKLGAHAASIDYLLFDSSHGTGKRMDADRLSEFLQEAYEASALDNVGMGVAGGLNAERVREDLPAIVAKFPNVSWDAEGQLHPVNNGGKRPLQMGIVKNYLQASTDALRS